MKTKLNISTVVLALSGFIVVQTATAQAPNPHPAQEALKGLQPFIGNWAGEFEAFGGFEGLEKGRMVTGSNRFRWILNKTAVQLTWDNTFKDDGKPFNFGTGIITLDPLSKKLNWHSFGYDGKVYWTGKGVGEFGKTLAGQAKERSKLGATLEGQREIYRQSRAAEGEQDRLTADYKAKLKAEGADTEDLTGIQSYLGSMTAWNKQNKENMTGEQHQDIIGTFDEELAGEAVVLHPKTIGIGDKAKTTMPEADQRKLNAAKDGDTLIIGEQIFIKDSSAPGGMRISSFTELKKLREAKSKKKKTYLDVAQGE